MNTCKDNRGASLFALALTVVICFIFGQAGLGRNAAATKHILIGKTVPANAASLSEIHALHRPGKSLGECYGGTCMDKRLNHAVADLGGYWGRNAGALNVESFISDIAYKESDFNLVTLLSHSDCAANKAIVSGVTSVPGVTEAIKRFPGEVEVIHELMSKLKNTPAIEVHGSLPQSELPFFEGGLDRYASSKSVLGGDVAVKGFANLFSRIVSRSNAKQVAEALEAHGKKDFLVLEGVLLHNAQDGFDYMNIASAFAPSEATH